MTTTRGRPRSTLARVTPRESERKRHAALVAAGGWVGRVELSPDAHEALIQMRLAGLSISQAVCLALTAAGTS